MHVIRHTQDFLLDSVRRSPKNVNEREHTLPSFGSQGILWHCLGSYGQYTTYIISPCQKTSQSLCLLVIAVVHHRNPAHTTVLYHTHRDEELTAVLCRRECGSRQHTHSTVNMDGVPEDATYSWMCNFFVMFLDQFRLTTCSGLAWSTAEPGGSGHGGVWSGPVRAQNGNSGHRYVPPGGYDFGLRREERADGGSSRRNVLVAEMKAYTRNSSACLSTLCTILWRRGCPPSVRVSSLKIMREEAGFSTYPLDSLSTICVQDRMLVLRFTTDLSEHP